MKMSIYRSKHPFLKKSGFSSSFLREYWAYGTLDRSPVLESWVIIRSLYRKTLNYGLGIRSIVVLETPVCCSAFRNDTFELLLCKSCIISSCCVMIRGQPFHSAYTKMVKTSNFVYACFYVKTGVIWRIFQTVKNPFLRFLNWAINVLNLLRIKNVRQVSNCMFFWDTLHNNINSQVQWSIWVQVSWKQSAKVSYIMSKKAAKDLPGELFSFSYLCLFHYLRLWAAANKRAEISPTVIIFFSNVIKKGQ